MNAIVLSDNAAVFKEKAGPKSTKKKFFFKFYNGPSESPTQYLEEIAAPFCWIFDKVKVLLKVFFHKLLLNMRIGSCTWKLLSEFQVRTFVHCIPMSSRENRKSDSLIEMVYLIKENLKKSIKVTNNHVIQTIIDNF